MGVALEARMEDTSLPAAAVRGKGTQGLLFPLRSLSPKRSLVFPQQTVGTMKAACSPPLTQKGLSILDLSDPEWPNQPSHENQVNDLLPLALLLVKWVTAIISISKTRRRKSERGSKRAREQGDGNREREREFSHMLLRGLCPRLGILI